MIELITSGFVLLSMLSGTAVASTKPMESQTPLNAVVVEDKNIVDGVALVASAGNEKTVEADVRDYFKDIPILAEIAGCESQFRQIGANGEIIQGKVNKGDIGVMQINKYYHSDEAAKLGLNLNTLAGNMTFGKWLYEKEGTAPWQSSAGCWDKSVAISKN